MISVITPVFNGEKHIEACIQSVIDQQCDSVEHIIMDGLSTDDTAKIAQGYAQRYKHIRLVSEPDNGQSDAMNKGIALAKGEILSILNVDDYYEQGAMNRALEIFDTLTEPTLITGNCNVWDSRGNLLYVNKPDKLDITSLLLGWEYHPHPVNPVAYYYHKSLHDLCGGYDATHHYTMDVDFILKAAKSVNTVYCDEIWGNYLFLEDTKTAQDQREGQAQARYTALLREHRKQLSLSQQLDYLWKKWTQVKPVEARRKFRRLRRKLGV